jgi:hypothetical protein
MILPGMPMMFPSAGGAGFTMTAEDADDAIGWAASGGLIDTDFGVTFGSASGDFSADGGTVLDCFFGGPPLGNVHTLSIDGGSQSATNVNIDGTNYPLTFSETSDGIDTYTFGSASSLFADGVDYDVVVT